MHFSLSKPVATSLVAVALAISGLTLFATAPAVARTLCHPDGRCYNTSGAPIYNGPGWHHHYYYRRHQDESSVQPPRRPTDLTDNGGRSS
jgi:hypothetical protein